MKTKKFMIWLFDKSKEGYDKCLFEVFTEFYKCLSIDEFLSNCNYLKQINLRVCLSQKEMIELFNYIQRIS